MVVTGFDERFGCGYVLCTGPDTADAAAAVGPRAESVSHAGITVLATPELAATLRDALVRDPVARLAWSGPEVPLMLDDATILAWLRHTVGGVLTVQRGP